MCLVLHLIARAEFVGHFLPPLVCCAPSWCNVSFNHTFTTSLLVPSRLQLSVDPAAGTAAEACSAAAPAPLLRCISHPAGGCLLQLSSGEVWLYSPGGRLEQLPGAAFPAPCPRMAAAPLDTLGEAFWLFFLLSVSS